MYTLRKDEAGRKEVLHVVNTKGGPLARTISRNGQPLNAEQRRRESRRIQELLHDPARQQEHVRKFQHDIRQGLDLMKILPDALLFRADRQQGQLLQLSFQPNPNFRPGSRAAGVSHAMQQHWTFGEFRPVPADLTLAQAAEMLQASQSSALLSPPTPQRRSAPSLGR